MDTITTIVTKQTAESKLIRNSSTYISIELPDEAREVAMLKEFRQQN